MKKWDAENPRPPTDLDDVIRHVDHIRDTIGIEHIGIGSDYDGMGSAPTGLEDVAGYPALFEELLKRGYSEEDLAKIAGENVLRVMEAVEKYSATTGAKKEAHPRFCFPSSLDKFRKFHSLRLHSQNSGVRFRPEFTALHAQRENKWKRHWFC